MYRNGSTNISKGSSQLIGKPGLVLIRGQAVLTGLLRCCYRESDLALQPIDPRD